MDITRQLIPVILQLHILLTAHVDAQHGTVGRPCEVSTDCGTGNYCAGNKRCACLTTYVEIDSYCWRSKLIGTTLVLHYSLFFGAISFYF